MVSNVMSAATVAVIALAAVCVAGSQLNERQEDVSERTLAQDSFNEAGETSRTLEKDLSEKIYNGEHVKSLSRAPYVVQVFVYTAYGSSMCSGVLVARDIVFAAAHCFGTPRFSSALQPNFTVEVCGGYYENNLNQKFEAPAKYCVGVKAVKIHKKFVEFKGYDISAIKLRKPIKGAKIATVSFRRDIYSQYGYQTGYIFGWGAVNSDQDKLPNTLRELKVIVQPPQGIKFANYHLMALSTEGQMCEGDSGGPLVVQQSGRPWKKVKFRQHVVVGVSSYGIFPWGCALGTPAFYSRFGHPRHARYLKKVVAQWGRKLRTTTTISNTP